jgi:hypothetical protein
VFNACWLKIELDKKKENKIVKILRIKIVEIKLEK